MQQLVYTPKLISIMNMCLQWTNMDLTSSTSVNSLRIRLRCFFFYFKYKSFTVDGLHDVLKSDQHQILWNYNLSCFYPLLWV